jgi:N-acetylglutamate synthase-like GNAT family acetyltransferase
MLNTKEIKDFKPVLEGLVSDFGYSFYHTILTWCGIIDDTDSPKKYWQIYLVSVENQVIGICGLYSLKENDKKELWLGWFGIIPSRRKNMQGTRVLNWLKGQAKELGCKKLFTYVDKDEKVLPFYEKNGFNTEKFERVWAFLSENSYASKSDFEDENDLVISCKL